MEDQHYKITFTEKTVSSIQTLGEIFASARQEQQESLDDIAVFLQISCFYLEALEAGNYAGLPSKIYTRNFVKKYAQFLQLDVQAMLKMFEHEWTLFEKHQLRLLDAPKEKGVKSTDLWKMPSWLRWSGATLLTFSILTYLGHGLYNLRQAPELVIASPSEELMLDKQIVEIAGISDPEAELFINNQSILSDQEGGFLETVALQPGLNIIEITAKKKYSRENTQYRKIIVESPSTFTINSGEDSPEPPVS